MVVAVEAAVSVWVAPTTGVPAVTVVIVWLVQPFVPVKVKPPTPPLEIFVMVTVGNLVLVNTQLGLAPAAVANASRVTVLVARFGVALPPDANPLQLIEVKVSGAGFASVIEVIVEGADKICFGPVTGVPDATVVIVWLDQPFVPVNV